MNNCCAGDYMSEPVRTVSQDSTLADCCAAMESAQLRRMPVVDSQGRVVGVVAQADIALNSSPSTTAEVVQEISRRSDERRVGKECVSTCKFRWSPSHKKK